MVTSEPPLRWLFLDLDSYFASCEQQAQPALRGKPVGVIPLQAETTVLLAASREAKRWGVKTGTMVADARVRCPGITFVLARHDLYTRYHHQILEAVDTCLPVDSVLSIDELICELTGSQRERAAALAMAEKVKRTFRERIGEILTCSIGLSCNRYLAKVASDMNKPNGITVIEKKDLPAKILHLGLRDFPGIGPKMETRFAEYGIRTTETLLQLSEEQMKSIWGGVGGVRFHRWLRGEEVDLPATQHRSLGHQHVLEPELRNPEGAWTVARKLLVKAAVRLRKEGFFARRLSLDLRFIDRETKGWQKDQRVEETQDTLVLQQVLKTLWDQRPRGNPFKVGVTLSDFVAATQHQLPLMGNLRRENLGPALDRLNAKFGKETVSLGGLYKNRGAAPTRIAFHRVPTLDEFDDDA